MCRFVARLERVKDIGNCPCRQRSIHCKVLRELTSPRLGRELLLRGYRIGKFTRFGGPEAAAVVLNTRTNQYLRS